MTVEQRGLVLRVATAADRPAIRRLFGALHAYNASLDPRFALAEGWERLFDEHLDRLWAQDTGIVYLACRGEETVGFVLMAAFEDSPLFRFRWWAELQAIFVDPGARGTSIAARLVAAGTDWARRRGYDRIQLFVTASNTSAKRFYQTLGFRSVQEIWRLEIGQAGAQLPDRLTRWFDAGLAELEGTTPVRLPDSERP